MGKLVLVRHGQSLWNKMNKFTGWVDVPLSEKGRREAHAAARKIKNIKVDVAFTSTLIRAHETLFIVLEKQNKVGIFMHKDLKLKKWGTHKGFEKKEIPIHQHWALNERYYGKLQGLNKNWARRKWGREQVHLWRRSWDIKPPGGESLKDTYDRAIPHFKKIILPLIKKQDVLVSAHGNSLRAIIKYLDNITHEAIPNLELPTGKPVVYTWKKGKLIKNS